MLSTRKKTESPLFLKLTRVRMKRLVRSSMLALSAGLMCFLTASGALVAFANDEYISSVTDHFPAAKETYTGKIILCGGSMPSGQRVDYVIHVGSHLWRATYRGDQTPAYYQYYDTTGGNAQPSTNAVVCSDNQRLYYTPIGGYFTLDYYICNDAPTIASLNTYIKNSNTTIDIDVQYVGGSSVGDMLPEPTEAPTASGGGGFQLPADWIDSETPTIPEGETSIIPTEPVDFWGSADEFLTESAESVGFWFSLFGRVIPANLLPFMAFALLCVFLAWLLWR